VLPDSGVEALLDSGAMVLLDQAYADFQNGGQAILPVRTDRIVCPPPNLVTFRTFSKAWGLAALRVGWLTSTAESCREIRKVKLPYSLNVISEAIAVAALENPSIRDRNVAAILAERDRVFAAMRAIPRITVFPTQANFITSRAEQPLFEALCARGILIRQVAGGNLRVSIGTDEQNNAFLAALKEIA